MNKNFKDLVPSEELDINELSNIKGGTEVPDDDIIQVCDSGACATGIEDRIGMCKNAGVCKTGA